MLLVLTEEMGCDSVRELQNYKISEK